MLYAETGRLRSIKRIGERVASEDDLRPFIDMLVRKYAPRTALQTVSGISNCVRAIDPTFDRTLIRNAANYLNRWARPVRDLTDRFIPSSALFQLGVELMREAETSLHLSIKHRAVLYRDGLMIAFLALVPIRRKNAQSLRNQHHIDIEAGGDRLVIPAVEQYPSGEGRLVPIRVFPESSR